MIYLLGFEFLSICMISRACEHALVAKEMNLLHKWEHVLFCKGSKVPSTWIEFRKKKTINSCVSFVSFLFLFWLVSSKLFALIANHGWQWSWFHTKIGKYMSKSRHFVCIRFSCCQTNIIWCDWDLVMMRSVHVFSMKEIITYAESYINLPINKS